MRGDDHRGSSKENVMAPLLHCARAFATGASLVVVAAAGVALVGARIAGGRRERERETIPLIR